MISIQMNEQLTREFKEKTTSAQQAVRLINNGDIVYIGTCSSVAYGLLEALWRRKEELEDVTLTGGLLINPVDALCEGNFKLMTYFIGPVERKRMNKAGFDFTSVHLSQTDIWIKETARPNTAFFEVSLPDENGYMSYGAGGAGVGTHVKDIVDTVILQINKRAPYVYGDNNLIHVSEADSIVCYDSELPEAPEAPEDETISSIANFLLEHIDDGACIQLGIGSIANAVGYRLRDKNDLGAHTEIITDSMMELMKLGVLNGSRKNFFPGKVATAVAFGSAALYNYLDHNENVYFLPFSELNSPLNIAKNNDMISINSAISMDLFGQVSSESIAGKQYSGTGGQLDYVIGAQLSKGGKSFLAVQSTVDNRSGGTASRIVSQFPPGTIVTTPRSETQYVVTEYGCVNLKPLTMRDRVKAMISLAHPDFRPQLLEEAKTILTSDPYGKNLTASTGNA